MSRTTRIPATPRGFAAILELYADAIPGRRYPEIRDHFARVARRAPATLVREGLKAALGARDTPPFPAMVARLFRTADPKLRAALIEHLMRRLGASATTGLATGTVDGAVLRTLSSEGRGPLPEEAARVRTDTVQRLAGRAARHDLSVLDDVSDLFASHAALATNLDGIALTHAMATMANQVRRPRKKSNQKLVVRSTPKSASKKRSAS